MPYCSLILYDLKEIDSVKHKEFTGAPNDVILENIVKIAEFKKEHINPQKLWIRTPLIPLATATEENVAGIGKFIAENLGNTVDRWELCAFNNLCKDKYERLGVDWKFKECSLLTKEFMKGLTEIAGTTGVNPSIVLWTGSTQIDEDDSVIKVNELKKYSCTILPSC